VPPWHVLGRVAAARHDSNLCNTNHLGFWISELSKRFKGVIKDGFLTDQLSPASENSEDYCCVLLPCHVLRETMRMNTITGVQRSIALQGHVFKAKPVKKVCKKGRRIQGLWFRGNYVDHPRS
jgi:hypothetical protein